MARLEADYDINTALCERQRRGLTGQPQEAWPPYGPGTRQRIITFGGGVTVSAEFDVQEVWPNFDRLQDNSWIIADARCGVVSSNARIIATHGKISGNLLLGDGIGHLQIDRNNRIWVGYFDEGVIGNNGWGLGGPEPVGAPGINCFDARGQLVWSNPGNLQPVSSFPVITNCEAMTVGEDAVWACTYRDHAILKIELDGGFGGIWDNEKAGASLIAEEGGLVVLLGGYAGSEGYSDQRCHGVLLKLENDGARRIGEFELDIDIDDFRRLPLAESRGSIMHFVKDDGWYELSVRDVAKELK